MKRQTLSIIISTLICTTGFSAHAAPSNVRAIKSDTITDKNIFYPESFETDTQKMLQDWYLKNYAVMDRTPERRTSATTSDEEYIDRLQRMPTTIEMPFNQIVKSYIEMYVQRKRSLVENMLGMSLYYMPIFEQALDKYGLPMELRYLPIIESALNPNAVSRAGATGLWQFMLPTATGLGLEVNSLVDQRRDPIASSDAAARYLKQLYDSFGDWSLAIAAYNCGPGNVNKAIRRAGDGKKDFWEIYRFLPQETRGYVPGFIAANYAMNYYDKHNISPALASRPIVTDTVHVTRRVHFQQIADVMNIPIEEIRILNPQYRADVIPGDIKPYALTLPNLQTYCYIANEDSIVNHDAELYARREVVEPATGTKASDDKGEYIEELTVKYHKVKKGETLSSIARRYGVSASEISRTNKIGKSVKRGQTLKINTYRRRYIATPSADSTQVAQNDSLKNLQAPVPAPVAQQQQQPATRNDQAKADKAKADKRHDNTEVVDSANVDAKTRSQVSNAMADSKKKQEKAEKPKKQVTQTHEIKPGENLSKIASKYGVTVDELKKANNLKDDKIQMGQSLKIPSKAKASSGRKSRKKRR
jgi:membrane-bound lytic murein transglycosylase D